MLIWHDDAWAEYLEWQKLDRKKFSKINSLLKEVMRTPYEGTGKPEPLNDNVRITSRKHRRNYRHNDLTGIGCENLSDL